MEFLRASPELYLSDSPSSVPSPGTNSLELQRIHNYALSDPRASQQIESVKPTTGSHHTSPIAPFSALQINMDQRTLQTNYSLNSIYPNDNFDRQQFELYTIGADHVPDATMEDHERVRPIYKDYVRRKDEGVNNLGESGYLNTTEVPKMEDILSGLTSDDFRTTIFKNPAQAHVFRSLLRKKERSFDPTIPHSQEDVQACVKTLFIAFKSTALADDGPGMLKPFNEERHHNETVEGLCWTIFSSLVARSTAIGAMSEAYEPGKTKDIEMSFAKRFNTVVEVMMKSKTICKHLFDTPFVNIVIDDPDRALKRVLANATLNKQKGHIMKVGKPIVEEQMERQRRERGLSTPDTKKTRTRTRTRKRSTEEEEDENIDYFTTQSPATPSIHTHTTPVRRTRRRTDSSHFGSAGRLDSTTRRVNNLGLESNNPMSPPVKPEGTPRSLPHYNTSTRTQALQPPMGIGYSYGSQEEEFLLDPNIFRQQQTLASSTYTMQYGSGSPYGRYQMQQGGFLPYGNLQSPGQLGTPFNYRPGVMALQGVVSETIENDVAVEDHIVSLQKQNRLTKTDFFQGQNPYSQ